MGEFLLDPDLYFTHFVYSLFLKNAKNIFEYVPVFSWNKSCLFFCSPSLCSSSCFLRYHRILPSRVREALQHQLEDHSCSPCVHLLPRSGSFERCQCLSRHPVSQRPEHWGWRWRHQNERFNCKEALDSDGANKWQMWLHNLLHHGLRVSSLLRYRVLRYGLCRRKDQLFDVTEHFTNFSFHFTFQCFLLSLSATDKPKIYPLTRCYGSYSLLNSERFYLLMLLLNSLLLCLCTVFF